MLQIQHVNKTYHTGDLVQRALDDVTINLRDNEFVAILGPSGSGKTTLLNIIGGLDRYDSGDLIIDGVSTKNYSDRDWDSYRNHKVGFVFQSYNLITHQTILANVELALTISGIGRKERRERAMEALEHVGLADQAHKLPAQLSGGQMQRVAIARALVNNPDILLADEPTGALDTDTSLQVMSLLKEVAQDRMVVMVTHNPDLAETYATRIIRLQDGAVCADSDPYVPDKEISETAYTKPPRAGMSFFTSAGLSLNNLMTKKARTILTAVAGSIGIIGIALILAISAGVNRYIDVLEADMVRQYPIEVENSHYDISAFVSARVIPGTTESVDVYDEDTVDISALIYNIFEGQTSNDLVALKDFIDNDGGGIDSYITSIEYSYGVTPQIYQDNTERVIQVHPDHFFDVLGFGSTTSANSIMSSLVDTDAFFQLPESEELYKDSYTVKAGRWPESYNELVLVLHEGTQTTDIGLYMMGLQDIADMEEMIDEFVAGEEVQQPVIDEIYTVDDFVGIKFKLVENTDLYEYDSEYGIWTDKSDDEAYMQKLVDNGEDLTIVGVVELNEDEDSGILSSGFNYMPSLITHLAKDAADSEIVQQQLADPEINVFTGEPFGEEDTGEEFDINSLFDIDEDTFAEVFSFDDDFFEDIITGATEDLTDSLNEEDMLGDIDLSGMVDLGSITISLPDMDFNLNELMSSIQINVSEAQLTELGTELLEGFRSYVSGNPQADIFQIGSAITEYLSTSEAREILSKNITDIIRASGGIEISTDSIYSLYSEISADFINWAGDEGFNIAQIAQLDSYIERYLGTSRAQSILDSWSDENLQNDLSGVTITEEQVQTLASELINGYESYASTHQVPDPALVGSYFSDYLGTSSAQQIFTSAFSSMISIGDMESQISRAISDYAESAASSIMEDVGSVITDQISEAAEEIALQIEEEITDIMTESMGGLAESMQDAFDVDPEVLLDAVVMNMDTMDLLDLLSAVTASGEADYESNLETLGYTDFSTPKSIDIYPKDFESKDEIIAILDNYNEEMYDAGDEDKVVSYSDSMGSIMSLIVDIVNILSYVLIAFVAISLVVSSIMIGVITYISVLERKKEIGILRAIGASKRNISQVFNAETAIIGLAAGLLGIIVTLLLIIPINVVVHRWLGLYDLSAYLPFWYALVLILLSVALTLLSGMIPARKASRSDPVDALRSE